MIQLQERDRLIVDTLYEQQFLRTDQVVRYLFRGTCDRVARRRILELERAGILRREEHVLVKGRSIVRLTQSGVLLAESKRPVRVPQARSLDARTLFHDSVVAAVRLRLRELWDGTWIPEALIKGEEFPQVPDGMIVFPNGRQAAIEVENTPKGPERFHEIQERWRKVSVRLVLYVATDATMLRIVRRYLESGPQDLPVGLVLWDDLERGTPLVWTVLGELDLLSRRTL